MTTTTTYAEAQYGTASAREMIRAQFLNMEKYPNPTPEHVESVARYMSKTLRVGGIADCRKLVLAAIQETV